MDDSFVAEVEANEYRCNYATQSVDEHQLILVYTVTDHPLRDLALHPTTDLHEKVNTTCTVKACPHCRRKVRLSPNSATVAVVSPFSATVALFCECGQGLSPEGL